MPDSHNDSAAAWAGRLLDEEVKTESDEVYKNARAILGLPRSEVSLTSHGNSGIGSVDTDFFRFSIGVRQDPDDCTNAAIVRNVVLRVPHAELPDNFDDIFPSTLNEIVVPFKAASSSFDDLADALESFAKQANASFEDIPRKQRIVLHFTSGLSVEVDAARSKLVFSMRNAVGCLDMIKQLEQSVMPRLIGETPAVIGAADAE